MYRHEVGPRASFLIAVPVVVLIIGALLWSIFGQRETMTLLPALPEPTSVSFSGDRSPVTVSFTELNDDPVAYLNQVIVVAGNYLPVEQTDCLRSSGPDIKWSLTAENLQLDVLGFERIVRLLPVGTSMTVQGVWRLYQGPLGCGKGPPNGTAWYLDVKKILQPNPLVSEGGQALPIIVGDGDPGLPDLVPTTDQDETVPTPTGELITVTPEVTGIAPPTLDPQVTFTLTPTPDSAITPTVPSESTPTVTVLTATAVSGTTVPEATFTPTATNDPNLPTATFTPELPPVPATATDLPDGYPAPTETVIPTATTDPYP